MQTENLTYFIDLRIPEASPIRHEVKDKVTIGSDDSCDICIKNHELAPKHCSLRIHNGVLSLCNLVDNGAVLLDGHPLVHGKMYIIDRGDQVELSDIMILIRKEIIETSQDQTIIEQISDKTGTLNLKKKSSKSIFSWFKRTKKIKKPSPDQTEKTQPLPVVAGPAKPTHKYQAPIIPKKQARTDKRPGPSARILAVILNLAFAIIIYNSTISYLKITFFKDNARVLSNQATQLFSSFSPQVSLLLKNIHDVIISFMSPSTSLSEVFVNTTSFILFYLCFNGLSHFLFATSFPLAMLTVRDEGSFLKKRLRAVIRSLMGTLMAPFIIFDFSLFFERRSFKEVLTKTHLYYKLTWAKWIMLPVLSFLLISLFVAAPFLKHSTFTYNAFILPPDPYFPKAPVIAAKTSSKANFEGASQKLGLEFNSELPSEWSLIPGIEPALSIIETKKQKTLMLDTLKIQNLSLFFHSLGLNYPLLSTFYPAINHYLESHNENKNLPPEITRFNQWALSLTFEHLPWFVLRNGPFPSEFLEQKKTLLKLHPGPGPYQLEEISIGDKPFIKIIGDFQNSSKQTLTAFVYIPLDQIKVYPLILSFRPGAESFANSFEQKWIRKAKPIKRNLNFKLNEVKNWNELSSIDFLDRWSQRLYPYAKSIHWPKLKKNYHDLARWALQNNHELLQNELKKQATLLKNLAAKSRSNLPNKNYWSDYITAIDSKKINSLP